MSGEVPRYTGIVNCFTRVSAEQGFGSFWRGNMANIVRPPDQGKFNTLNPKKMYAAANVVPDETAGYQLSDCAFKNITANSKNDPILDVARMFPGVSAHQNMMQKIDAQTFPVSSTYPLALRQTFLGAVDMRPGISSSSAKAMKKRSGARNQLRNGDALWYGASANVGNQAAKNPALVGMVLNASDAWFTAASQGAGLTNQRVA